MSPPGRGLAVGAGTGNQSRTAVRDSAPQERGMGRSIFRHSGIMAHRRGFALLELLVALTVLGLTVTLLAGGVRFGTRVWEQHRRNVAFNDGALTDGALWESLRPLLASIEPQALPGHEASRALWFDGAAEQVTFIALPLAAALSGRRQWRLSRDVNGRLRLDHRPWPPASAEDVLWQPDILHPALSSLEIAYWGPPAAFADPVWLSHWQQRVTLPTLIRLRLGTTHGSHSGLTEGVVALRLSAP